MFFLSTVSFSVLLIFCTYAAEHYSFLLKRNDIERLFTLFGFLQIHTPFFSFRFLASIRFFILFIWWLRSEQRRWQFGIKRRLRSFFICSVSFLLAFCMIVTSPWVNSFISCIFFLFSWILISFQAYEIERQRAPSFRNIKTVSIVFLLISAESIVLNRDVIEAVSIIHALVGLVLLLPMLVKQNDPVAEIEQICASGSYLLNAREALASPLRDCFLHYCDYVNPNSIRNVENARAGSSSIEIDLSAAEGALQPYWGKFTRWQPRIRVREPISLDTESSEEDESGGRETPLPFTS